MTDQKTSSPSLFMVLLGSKAPNRNVEQHDYFFGIAHELKELVPALKAFWPEAGNSLHIDGWRRIRRVGDFQIRILERDAADQVAAGKKIFFVNLGGYQSGKLEEQHYTLLGVHDDRLQAIQSARKTVFFKMNTIKGAAHSHIDDKYGIDVDDVYRIEDILSPAYKEKYQIEIIPAQEMAEDELCLGYLKLDKLR